MIVILSDTKDLLVLCLVQDLLMSSEGLKDVGLNAGEKSSWVQYEASTMLRTTIEKAGFRSGTRSTKKIVVGNKLIRESLR